MLLHIRLLLFVWNAVGFGACAYLLFRECAGGVRIWGGVRTALLVLDVALIYVVDVRLEPLMPPVSDLPLAIRDAFNFAVPPLIVDMFFQEERKTLRRIAW